MKAIKITLSIIGLIIFICVFAAACLVYFVDPDKLKPLLIEEVRKETGYIMTIDGKLTWSFYPRLAVKAVHLQLKEPKENRPFLDAENVHIATDLLAVLQSREEFYGKVSMSTLLLMNIKSENVSANIGVENKNVSLDEIQASLYGGKLQGSISAHNFASSPQWQWKIQLDKIQIKPLLQDVNGADSKIKLTGIATFSMQAETKGNDREQMLRQLNGSSIFHLEDGSVEGVDLNYFVQLADATINKQPVFQLVNTNQTNFSLLDGTAVIRNGIANTNDLLLTAPAFVTKGEGSIELLNRKLDFELKVKPQLQNSKMKWGIPVLVTGDVHHPDVNLDMMEVQKILASIEINNLKKKASEQIQKHIKGKTGELLQNLLGN